MRWQKDCGVLSHERIVISTTKKRAVRKDGFEVFCSSTEANRRLRIKSRQLSIVFSVSTNRHAFGCEIHGPRGRLKFHFLCLRRILVLYGVAVLSFTSVLILSLVPLCLLSLSLSLSCCGSPDFRLCLLFSEELVLEVSPRAPLAAPTYAFTAWRLSRKAPEMASTHARSRSAPPCRVAGRTATGRSEASPPRSAGRDFQYSPRATERAHWHERSAARRDTVCAQSVFQSMEAEMAAHQESVETFEMMECEQPRSVQRLEGCNLERLSSGKVASVDVGRDRCFLVPLARPHRRL